MYKLNTEQMVIEDTDKKEIICLVNTKRPDLFEGKVNALLDKANNYDKAIELLKEFAFYNIDASLNEQLENVTKVQEFLKNTPAKNWLEEELDFRLRIHEAD